MFGFYEDGMYFSLLKRDVTYHVKILGEFGCGARRAPRGGRHNARPRKTSSAKTVGRNVCSEQTAASVEGKRGGGKAL